MELLCSRPAEGTATLAPGPARFILKSGLKATWSNVQIQTAFGHAPSEAESSKAMVVGTTDPLAVHAGVEVLKHGGNAVDAALATSLAQIALSAGAIVSYAGILTAIHYDSATGKVETLNAGYDTVRGELDALSIPDPETPSGRTVLVPGFMAGVEALHRKHGRLPFASLFEPAIWVAEEGVPLSETVGQWMAVGRGAITRLPEGAEIFTNGEGKPYAPGDLFRQPGLAETLKRVAGQGAGYMYEGEWAERFVEAVRSEGGKMEMEDLAAYQAIWGEPAHISYGDYEVFSLGEPSVGGLITLGSLNVAQAAKLSEYGHYASSAEALYYLIQIMRSQTIFAFETEDSLERQFPSIDSSPEARLTEEVAQQFWEVIRERAGSLGDDGEGGGSHSAGVLAVDDEGNVVSILHSINTVLWGSTGLFVGGVSIPDSAYLQRGLVQRAGPGGRLTESTNPTLVTKQGRPFLASTAIGSGLQQVTVQNLINVLDFGMAPRDAIQEPNTLGYYQGGTPTGGPIPEAVLRGAFPESVLEGTSDLGQPFERVNTANQAGYWAAIQIDEANGRLSGVASGRLKSLVEGY